MPVGRVEGIRLEIDKEEEVEDPIIASLVLFVVVVPREE